MSIRNPFELPHVTKSDIVFEESIIKVRRDRLNPITGDPYTYYTLETKPFAVIVLAITTDGRYLINYEYRHPTGKVLLSLPAGYVEVDENPIDAARRELLEETGFAAKKYEILGRGYPYAGISCQENIYILATNAECVGKPQFEASELLVTELKSPEELHQNIMRGGNFDANLGAALFFKSIYC